MTDESSFPAHPIYDQLVSDLRKRGQHVNVPEVEFAWPTGAPSPVRRLLPGALESQAVPYEPGETLLRNRRLSNGG